MAPARSPSAMSQRSASLSLSAILLARSTVLEKAASKVSAIGSMAGSIGTAAGNRNAQFGRHRPSNTAYVQRIALLQPDGVDSQPGRAGFLPLEQRDVRYPAHVHQAVSRSAAYVFEADAKGLALAC